MLNKIDRELAFVQSALNLRAQRQEMLASNIANADTPNYKARDMDFASALRGALRAGQGGPLTLTRTSSRHFAGSGFGGAGNGLTLYRAPLQPSLDGNTVDMDVERAHFAENALHYQFLVDRATATFSTLKLAVGDR